ncbi:hypothetical protein JCM8208_000186 [Rhodotorula glutinis]
MRTAFLASLLALASFVAAAPVAVVDETAVAPAVEPSADLAFEDSSEVVNVLEKRGNSCSKVSQCKNWIPNKSTRTCSSKKCGWKCNSGYTKSGNQCNKNKSSSSSSSSTKKVTTNFATSSSFTGKGTWYTQGGAAGSCGKVNSDSAYIVAMNSPQVAGGSHCGQYVTVTNTANGKSVRAQVADTCPGCSYGSLDLSLGAFKAIGNLDTGVLPLRWNWS